MKRKSDDQDHPVIGHPKDQYGHYLNETVKKMPLMSTNGLLMEDRPTQGNLEDDHHYTLVRIPIGWSDFDRVIMTCPFCVAGQTTDNGKKCRYKAIWRNDQQLKELSIPSYSNQTENGFTGIIKGLFYKMMSHWGASHSIKTREVMTTHCSDHALKLLGSILGVGSETALMGLLRKLKPGFVSVLKIL